LLLLLIYAFGFICFSNNFPLTIIIIDSSISSNINYIHHRVIVIFFLVSSVRSKNEKYLF
jgi:hypothetical protein